MDGAFVLKNKNNTEYKVILVDQDTLQCEITQHSPDSASYSNEEQPLLITETRKPSMSKIPSKIPSAGGLGSRLPGPRRKLPAPPPPMVNGDVKRATTLDKGKRANVYVVDSGHSSDTSTTSNQVDNSQDTNQCRELVLAREASYQEGGDNGLSPQPDPGEDGLRDEEPKEVEEMSIVPVEAPPRGRKAPPPRPPKLQLSPREQPSHVSRLSKPTSFGIPKPRQSHGAPQLAIKTMSRPRSVDVSMINRNTFSIRIEHDDNEQGAASRRRALSSERTRSLQRPMTFVPDKDSKLTPPSRKPLQRKLSSDSKTQTVGSKSSLVETIRTSLSTDKDEDDASNKNADNSINDESSITSVKSKALVPKDPPQRPEKPPELSPRHLKSPSASSLTLTVFTDNSRESPRVEQKPSRPNSRGSTLRSPSVERPSFLARFSPKTSPREETPKARSITDKTRSLSRDRESILAKYSSPKTSPREETSVKKTVKQSYTSRFASPKTSPREETSPSKTSGTKPITSSRFTSPKTSPRDESACSKIGQKGKSSYLSRYMYPSPKSSPRDEETKKDSPRSKTASSGDTQRKSRPSSLPLKPVGTKREGSIPRPTSLPKRESSNERKTVPERPAVPPRSVRPKSATTTPTSYDSRPEVHDTRLKVPDNDDSGINSSKDSDFPAPHLPGSHPASPMQGYGVDNLGSKSRNLTVTDNENDNNKTDTFSVVKCADSMLSVYEIEEDTGTDIHVNPYSLTSSKSESQSHKSGTLKEESVATTTLCSSEKDDEHSHGGASSLLSRISTARHSPLYHGTETDRETPTPHMASQPSQQPPKRPEKPPDISRSRSPGLNSGLKPPTRRAPHVRTVSEGPLENEETEPATRGILKKYQRRSWDADNNTLTVHDPLAHTWHATDTGQEEKPTRLVKQISGGNQNQLRVEDKQNQRRHQSPSPSRLKIPTAFSRQSQSPARQDSNTSSFGNRNTGIRSPIRQIESPYGQSKRLQSPVSSGQRRRREASPNKDTVVTTSVNDAKGQRNTSLSRDIVVLSAGIDDDDAAEIGNGERRNSVSYMQAKLATPNEHEDAAVSRTITVQTNKKNATDPGHGKPPSPQPTLSLLKRPNSPRTMSPLIPVKPHLIRKDSFKDRKPPESPRSRSPVLGNHDDRLAMTFPGDRGSYSSVGSEIMEQEFKQGRGSRPSLLSLYQGKSTGAAERDVADKKSGSRSRASPVNNESPRRASRNSPILAFPSALGKDQARSADAEAEEPPPPLPPKGISPRSSPRASPVTSVPTSPTQSSSQQPSLAVREPSPSRGSAQSRLIQPRKIVSPVGNRDNSPLSMLLNKNRKLQEASSLVTEPKRGMPLGETYPPKYTSSIARISRSRDSSPVSSQALTQQRLGAAREGSPAQVDQAPPVPRPRSTPAKISYVEKEEKSDRPTFSGIPKGKIGTVVKRDGSPIQAGGADQRLPSSPVKFVSRLGSPLGKPPHGQRTPSPDTAKHGLLFKNRIARSDRTDTSSVVSDSCDSQSESYATLSSVTSPRKKMGILKQFSDESDASEYLQGGGRESPSKKKVTFDRIILEKEEQKAMKEVRDQNRKDTLNKFMKRLSDEKGKHAVPTRSVSLDTNISEHASNIDNRAVIQDNEGNPEANKSGARMRKKYSQLTNSDIQNLRKYLINTMATSRMKYGRSSKEESDTSDTDTKPKVVKLKHSNSDTELPLYSKVVKKPKTLRIPQESDEEMPSVDLVNKTNSDIDPDNPQAEDEYVTLSDLKIVMKCNKISKDLAQSGNPEFEREEREFDDIGTVGADLGDVSIMLVDKDMGREDLVGILEDEHSAMGDEDQVDSGTSRPARRGEANGVDYTFVTVEEFLALQKSGNLLESGMYDGHHYGTPKPPKDPPTNLQRSNSMGTALHPGLHPSSEGKRKRNRSINELNKDSPSPQPHDNNVPSPLVRTKSLERAHGGAVTPSPLLPGNHMLPDLGPLPSNWEMAYTEDGTPYFIDHNTGQTQWQDPRFQAPRQSRANTPTPAAQPHTNSHLNSHSSETTHWLDPRLAKNKKLSALECDENELPYGWEKVEDPHYGTYFIDHVNRKTQYENPVLQAKRRAKEEKDGGPAVSKDNDINGNKSPPAYVPPQRAVFTKNPDQLRGEFLKTQLEKSPRGFGFTILGGNDVDEEFLQIKNVVPGGPAASDGKLKTGDVLVYVNGQCVLGYTHTDVVSIFQTIPIGQKVTLEVCRGYPLPFDPDDPDTTIVTRMAVTLPQDSRLQHSPPEYSRGGSTNHSHTNNDRTSILRNNRPELITVHIVKGEMGFGFTIADSAYGQKVRQVLDRERCLRLNEGDILVEINEHKVKDMPHSDVVRVLKECPQMTQSRIVIQRGGMLHSHNKHKQPAGSEERRLPGADGSSVPNNQLYGPDDGEGGSLLDEGIDTRLYPPLTRLNDSHDSGAIVRDHNAPDLVNSSQQRSRTPNPNPELERKHSRSPADMLGHEVDSYTRNNQSRDFMQYNNTNRNDLSSRSFSQYDRREGDTTSRYRSRTPGPEFMRSREREDEQYFGGTRGRDTARSKTPTSELFKQQPSLSGTPNFIPASRYQSPPRGHPGYQQQDPRGYNRPQSSTDFTQHGAESRIPASQSYNSALSKHQNAPYGTDAMRASGRKQSTSFEYVDPRPSNLTRIPYLDRVDGQNEALNRSRSPFDDDRVVEMSVHLQRQESGFGFRIVGGTEEGSQVAVGHLVPGGAADVDGQLRVGDEIIMVDNEVVLGASHRKVVQLISRCGTRGQVHLAIRRRLGPIVDPVAHAQSYPYDVTVTRREHEGFGFVIISSVTRSGSVIGRISEGSPATRCGRLHVGDRILAVNNTNIMHMHHEDIVKLIKDSGYSVTLTVGPPQASEPVYQALLTMADQAHYESSSNASQSSQRVGSNQGSMINAMAYPAQSESDISRRSDYSPHHVPSTPPHQNNADKYQQQILEKHRELARQRAHSSSQASPVSSDEEKMHRIELHRGSRGFGFSIRGGREFNNMPLYVLKIAPGGAAALDQRMKVGDEIVEINGLTTANMTHAEAIDLIQAHGSTVTLVVRRTGALPPHLAHGGQPGSQLPVRSHPNTAAPTLTVPNGPSQGPLSQSSPNPNRRPPDTGYFHSNFPRY